MDFTEIVKYSEYLRGFGLWTLPLLFALIVIQCHIPVMPFSIISSICGFMFGFKTGVAFSLISVTVGSTIAFYLYRCSKLDNLARRMLGDRRRMPEEFVFAFIIIAHNIPVIPIAVANVIAALSRISAPKFVSATALGLLIPSLGFVAVGAGINTFLVKPGYSTLLPILIILLMFYLLKKYSPRISEMLQQKADESREGQPDNRGE